MSDDPRLLDPEEFRSLGFLQEVNRNYLHPLGLALAVGPRCQGRSEEFFVASIWDYRSDPEGIYFAASVLDPDKARRVRAEHERHVNARIHLFGHTTVQPLDWRPPS